jgi:hypothetical protein
MQNPIAPLLDDNRVRGKPRLPGSEMPASWKVPPVYIYQPAPSATQSGRAHIHDWVLEFEPGSRRARDFLMGWTSSQDPFASIPPLRFPDRESAIAFAEREGWRYVVKDPPPRTRRAKSYADNFRYDLSGAIARAQRPWDGTVSMRDGQQPKPANSDGSDRTSVPAPESRGVPMTAGR